MLFVRKRSWLPAKLLLVFLVAGAQSGALAHVFEHQAATPLIQACAICATISQLDACSIDTLGDPIALNCRSCRPIADGPSLETRHAPEARQRGPPTAL